MYSGREIATRKQDAIIERIIEPEFHRLFGYDEGCRRKENEVNWGQVHEWEREFIALLGLNITLSDWEA